MAGSSGIVGFARRDRGETTLLALGPAPVVGELVASDPDQPRRSHLVDLAAPNRRDGGHERLGREVLGIGAVPDASHHVAVHLREHLVVAGEQHVAVIRAGGGGVHTTLITTGITGSIITFIVAASTTPTVTCAILAW